MGTYLHPKVKTGRFYVDLGEWLNNIMNGYGEYHMADGNTITGSFVDGIPRGNCKIEIAKDSYCGNVIDGVFSGNVLCYNSSTDNWKIVLFSDGTEIKVTQTGFGLPNSQGSAFPYVF